MRGIEAWLSVFCYAFDLAVDHAYDLSYAK
jgi:hypothetical protein